MLLNSVHPQFKMKNSRGNSASCSGNEDRISSLPDALIHEILSFIDMKYVVQTCVLSRRWRYIWTSLPVLRFDCFLHEDEDLEDSDDLDSVHVRSVHKRFVNSVNKVLSLRDKSDIHTFNLDGYNRRIIVDDAYKWITTAVSHNVQELDINILVPKDFEIPACLCTCKSLTKLGLELDGNFIRGCKIILPSAMSLPRLKSLRLCRVNLSLNDGELANKFFSSFPTLESLVMTNCRFGGLNLSMSFSQLKYFELNNDFPENSNEVKLCAPSLTSLKINGYMSTNFTLENLSSLVHADMNLRFERDHRIFSARTLADKKERFTQLTMRLLRGLHNAKILKLNNCPLEALGVSPDILGSQPLEFYNLQLLKISVHLSRDSVRSIFYILKISPNMESLSLTSEPKGWQNPYMYPFQDVVFVENSTCSFHRHLKFVEIKGFRGHYNELKFLEILLKHATVLEKVVLCSSCTKKNLKQKEKQKEKQMEKFCEMLLTFPRASTNVMISYSVSVRRTFLETFGRKSHSKEKET